MFSPNEPQSESVTGLHRQPCAGTARTPRAKRSAQARNNERKRGCMIKTSIHPMAVGDTEGTQHTNVAQRGLPRHMSSQNDTFLKRSSKAKEHEAQPRVQMGQAQSLTVLFYVVTRRTKRHETQISRQNRPFSDHGQVAIRCFSRQNSSLKHSLSAVRCRTARKTRVSSIGHPSSKNANRRRMGQTWQRGQPRWLRKR